MNGRKGLSNGKRFSEKKLKKLKKPLDIWHKVGYNINTVREGKPNKPERN